MAELGVERKGAAHTPSCGVLHFAVHPLFETQDGLTEASMKPKGLLAIFTR